MAEKQKPLKHQVSYKENIRDVAIYKHIEEKIKDNIGISNYFKMLAEQDMRSKGLWKWD